MMFWSEGLLIESWLNHNYYYNNKGVGIIVIVQKWDNIHRILWNHHCNFEYKSEQITLTMYTNSHEISVTFTIEVYTYFTTIFNSFSPSNYSLAHGCNNMRCSFIVQRCKKNDKGWMLSIIKNHSNAHSSFAIGKGLHKIYCSGEVVQSFWCCVMKRFVLCQILTKYKKNWELMLN